MAARSPRLRYHCVSVVPCRNACEAATAIAGQRLLSAEAPRLPLATCQVPAECTCTYRHYDDRRAGPRRSEDRGELSNPWSLTERRRPGGRRVTDE